MLNADQLIADMAALRAEADQHWAQLEQATAKLHQTAGRLIRVSEDLVEDEFDRRMRAIGGLGGPRP